MDAQLQTAGVERLQRGLGIHAAIERFIPRGGRLAPFLSRITVVIARELPLGGKLIEVLLIAANREWQYPGPTGA